MKTLACALLMMGGVVGCNDVAVSPVDPPVVAKPVQVFKFLGTVQCEPSEGVTLASVIEPMRKAGIKVASANPVIPHPAL